MVMVKRIRKSDNEIWTITVYGELNGEMVEGPALKLENLNPNDLTPHFEKTGPLYCHSMAIFNGKYSPKFS